MSDFQLHERLAADTVFLADWTSLHLDVIARDRGLKRLAGSLFDFDSMLTGDVRPPSGGGPSGSTP